MERVIFRIRVTNQTKFSRFHRVTCRLFLLGIIKKISSKQEVLVWRIMFFYIRVFYTVSYFLYFLFDNRLVGANVFLDFYHADRNDPPYLNNKGRLSI